MAEKKKFQIPSAAEIEKDAVSSKQGSLSAFDKFKQMKKEGKVSSVCDLDESLRSDRLTSDKPSSVPGPARSEYAGVQKVDKMSGNRAGPSVKPVTLAGKSDNSKSEPSEVKPVTLAGKSDHSKSEPSEVKPSTSADGIQLTAKSGKGNYIVVNIRQRGNPILKHIRSIPYEYGDIVPDYVMGQSTCALFLSLRYHQLNPNYIHDRLKKLGRSYELRVLLVQVDIKEPQHLVKELAKICILTDCTLMLAFSPEEAGRYLETYKVYENKPADAIMEKTDKDYMSKMIDCLTSVKSVNKTDSMTLLSKFGTLEGVMNASKEDLTLCPGFGPQKAKRLHDIFQEPFLKTKKLKD